MHPAKMRHRPAAVASLLPAIICRVHASEVCRSWREATTCPALWRSLKFVLSCDDDEASAEAFLAWLLSRAAAVETLHIDIQDSAVRAACCRAWLTAPPCAACAHCRVIPVQQRLVCWPAVSRGCCPAASHCSLACACCRALLVFYLGLYKCTAFDVPLRLIDVCRHPAMQSWG
jgi:hypothetical protein